MNGNYWGRNPWEDPDPDGLEPPEDEDRVCEHGIPLHVACEDCNADMARLGGLTMLDVVADTFNLRRR